MGIPVLIIGDSGSGKTAALRNFKNNEIGIFNVAGKPLPFKNNLKKMDNVSYDQIKKGLKVGKVKSYVIDDSQYLMAFESFNRAKETGYNKFTDIAYNFEKLIEFIIKDVPKDYIVYFLHHTESTESGKIKAKTLGKMLDSQLTVEGLFSIVLLCKADGKEHYFETQSDGYTTCKSPIDMFEFKIDNDLKAVDKAIREYYELDKVEEVKDDTKA